MVWNSCKAIGPFIFCLLITTIIETIAKNQISLLDTVYFID